MLAVAETVVEETGAPKMLVVEDVTAVEPKGEDETEVEAPKGFDGEVEVTAPKTLEFKTSTLIIRDVEAIDRFHFGY